MLLSRLRTLALLACCLSLLAGPASAADGKKPARTKKSRKPVITKFEYDPDAEQVALFDGVEHGQLTINVKMSGPHGGFAFIENTTDKPLTVQLPDAVVGVQVLEQFGGMGGMGGMGMGGMGMGGMGMGGMGMGGMAQPAGGGFGGQGMMGGMGGMGGGMGMMGGGMGGGNFFSIPPEKVARLPITTVCLAHGRPDPHHRMNYTLVPVEEFTSDPVVQELVRMVGTGKIETGAAQAAAWHLTDKMSWQELASKQVERLGGAGNSPYFSGKQLLGAQSVVAEAAGRARERAKEQDSEPFRSPGRDAATVAVP